jgi:pyruvate dehydrogenase E2 component (dihydrolipoamide acetyltransferase)
MELRIPRENANDDQVIVTRINFSSGDKVSEGDIILEFETSKAVAEFVAPASGIIELLDIEEGAEIQVDSIIGAIRHPEGQSPSFTTPVNTKEQQKSPALIPSQEGSAGVVSDAAAALLNTGETIKTDSYWVTSADLLNGRSGKAPKQSQPGVSKKSRSIDQASSPTSGLGFSSRPGTNRKKLETKSLSYTSSYFNSTLGVPINLKSRRVTDHFFDNSILDLVLYECGQLLSNEFNDLNSFYLGENTVGLYEEVHGGFAVDTGGNLTVVRVDNLSNLQELSKSIIEKVSRFEDGEIKAEDVAPATFTVSDLSSGSTEFILPLINGEQTFILGIVRAESGYKIFGTFDHRVTEGRRFSDFLATLKTRIEAFELPQTSVVNICCATCLKSLEEERSLGNRGLIQIFTGNGAEFICRSCYDGW